MSSVFYFTRLYWSSHTHRGTAKLHDHEVTLHDAPVICGHACDCDYTPEVHVARIKEEFKGWRDMFEEEIADANRLLQDLVPDESH